jgi:hypothetical protein
LLARTAIQTHASFAAEMAIDGAYRTADDMEANLRRQSIQARLDHGLLMITTV